MNEKITGNEPINPVDEERMNDNYVGKQIQPKLGIGLTIRQYFAGLALQGLLANSMCLEIYNRHGDLDKTDEFYAKCSVEHADALIAELNKEK